MQKPIIDNSVVGVRSIHNLSYNWTGSADFGRIIPFHVQELVPTDKVQTCAPRIEMEMLPLASPTFGKLDLYVHYFFVPTRLCWDNAYDFLSESGTEVDDEPPYWTLRDFYEKYHQVTEGTKRALFKHWTSFGLPPFWESDVYSINGVSASKEEKITLLPFRAYNQIWWDYYRDPELIRDSSKNLYLYTEGGHQQTGVSDVYWYLPQVRMITDSWISNLFAESGQGALNPVQIAGDSVNPSLEAETAKGIYKLGDQIFTSGNYSSENSTDNIGQLSPIEIRKIEAITRMSERLSLGGKRQIDRLFAKYGVKPEWSKLNMCQYLGGAKSTVLVSDITSSADTATDTGGLPLGMKAGAGYCAFDDLNIKYTAQEHGYLIGVFSVMPHVHFVQGIGKQWFRNTREDFFTRELEHVGQVAVPKIEVGVQYADNFHYVNPASDLETFAFSQPYYEYKRGIDILAGDFMKYHAVPVSDLHPGDFNDLGYMHSMEMYVDFNELRRYNAECLKLEPLEFNKIFYYLGGNTWTDVDDHFHLCIDNKVILSRPMDGYAVPTLETTKVPHAATAPVGSDVTL